jgi:hypothetical protein
MWRRHKKKLKSLLKASSKSIEDLVVGDIIFHNNWNSTWRVQSIFEKTHLGMMVKIVNVKTGYINSRYWININNTDIRIE